MNERALYASAAAGSIVTLVAGLALSTAIPTLALALLVPPATAAVGHQLFGTRPLVAIAALVTGAWPLPHLVGAPAIGAALALAAVCLVPELPRYAEGGLAALAAATGTMLVTGSVVGTVLAAVAAALVAAGRPRAPTQATLTRARALALFAPAIVLFAAFTLNALTQRLDALAAPGALAWGIGLTGLATYVGLGALGVATLLETSEPAQTSLWLALASAAGILAGSLVWRDPSATIALVVAAAAPLGLLAALGARRVALGLDAVPKAAGTLPALAVAIQWGLVLV